VWWQQLPEQAYHAYARVVGQDDDAGRLVWNPAREGQVTRIIAGVVVGRVPAEGAGKHAVAVSGGDHPGLAGVLVLDRRVRRAHRAQRAVRDQLPGVQPGGEPGHVGRGRPEIAGAGHGVQVERRHRLAVLVTAGGQFVRTAANGGRGQAQRGQDPLGDELRVGLTAGLLHDAAGEQEAGAAVVPGRARRGPQRRPLDDRDALADVRRLGRIQAGRLQPVRNAGGVGQQVMQRDPGPLRRPAGQPAVHRIVQGQAARFGQEQDRRRGDLLAHRAELEPGLRGARCSGRHVG
jgi:hypothetical protein